VSTNEEKRAVLMLGKPVADAIEARVAEGARAFTKQYGVVPTLNVVLVGEEGPSARYVAKKQEACARLGMKAEITRVPASVEAAELRDLVAQVSSRKDVHGVLVQLPLPARIEEHDARGVNKFDVFDAIAAEKDVDGVGRDAIAALYRAQQERLLLMPGTALAVRRMMAFYGVETTGKRAVVVGRNDITAKPILHMLGGRLCNAAAIWIHRHVKPEDQRALIAEADILVTAVGVGSYRITGEMLKPGAAVFDVATRVDEHGKLHGDVELESAIKVAGFLTPVPRGIGPVTVAALCENLLRAAELSAGVSRRGYEF
jgi:methylenetetrahydrofolate dehydrogenase (NADP+)/methenyltetrahydrofolate cyclohydrolase